MTDDYILKIILRARDEMASVLARARREVDQFARQVNRADSEVDGLNSRISGLNRRLGNTVSRVRAVRNELRELGSGSGQASRGLDQAGDAAARSATGLRQVSRASREADRDQRGMTGTLNRWVATINQSGDSINTLTSRLRGLALVGAAAFAQQLISVLVALGGTMISVASSAAQAGIAIGGAFSAGIAQAVPAVGLLAAAFSRVGSVMDAIRERTNGLKQAQTQQAQETGKQEDATNRIRDASDGLASAQRNLSDSHRNVADSQRRVADAQRNLRDSQLELTKARRDARRELEDMRIAEERGSIGVGRARLALRRATSEQRSAALPGRPSTGREEARLNVEEAQLDLREARLRGRRDRADLGRAEAGGVQGMDQVVAARRAVGDARRGVQDAVRGVSDARRGVTEAEIAVQRARRGVMEARREANRAASTGLSAARNLDYMLSQMSSSERGLYRALVRIQNTYRREFRGISDIIIRSFTRTVDRVNTLLGDRRILSGFRGLATGIGRSIDSVTRVGTNRESQRQLLFFMEEARKNLPLIALLVNRLGRSFANIAEAASPALRLILRWTAQWAGRLKEATGERTRSGAMKMSGVFESGAHHLRAWVGLLGSIINLFMALSGSGGSASGLKTVRDLTDQINAGADAIYRMESGTGSVSEKFESMRRSTYAIADVLWELGKAIFESFKPEYVENFARFLERTLIPAIKITVEALGPITDLILRIGGSDFVAPVLKWVFALTLASRIMSTIAKLALGSASGFTRGADALARGYRKVEDIGRRGGPNLPDSLLGSQGALNRRLDSARSSVGNFFRGITSSAQAAGRTVRGTMNEMSQRRNPQENPFQRIAGNFDRVAGIDNQMRGLDRQLVRQQRTLATRMRSMASSMVSPFRGIGERIGAQFRPVANHIARATQNAGRVMERNLERAGIRAGREGAEETGRGYRSRIAGAIGGARSRVVNSMERLGTLGGRAAGREGAQETGTLFGRRIRGHMRDQEGRAGRAFGAVGRLGGMLMVAAFMEQMAPALGNGIANFIDGVGATFDEALRKMGLEGKNSHDETMRRFRGWVTDPIRGGGERLGRVGGGRSAFESSRPQAFGGVRPLQPGPGRQTGGPVPGTGSGDIVPLMAEPGEFVVRRDTVNRVGMGAMQQFNATARMPQRAGSRPDVGIGRGDARKAVQDIGAELSALPAQAIRIGNRTGASIGTGIGAGARQAKRSAERMKTDVVAEITSMGRGGVRQTERMSTDLDRGYTRIRRDSVREFKGMSSDNVGELRTQGRRSTQAVDRMRDDVVGAHSRMRRDTTRESRRLSDGTVREVGEMRKVVRLRTDRMGDEVASNFGSMRIKSVRRMRQMTESTEEGFGEMSSVATRRSDRMNANVSGSIGEMSNAVYKGMTYIGAATNDALKAFDVDRIKLDVPRPKAMGKGKAVGGFVGNRGERGKDTEHTVLGRGEAVLAGHHQGYVESALYAQYGHGLEDMFRRTSGYHAGGPEQPGYAKGGIVPIPRMPGERIHRSILPAVNELIKKFKIAITDGWASGGHSGNSDHYWGGALDIVPGRGGNWGLVDKLARLAEPRQNQPVHPFRWVGYCVPTHVKVLTRDGWKTWDEIIPDEDETLGYNEETGQNEWTTIRSVHRFDDQETVTLERGLWNTRVTPLHKWSVSRRKHGPQGVNEYSDQLVQTVDLRSTDRIRLSAFAEGGELDISPAEAAVVAWLMGDGCVQTRHRDGKRRLAEWSEWNDHVGKATIYQSKPEGLSALRRLLADVPHSTTHRSDLRPGTNHISHRFAIRPDWIREVLIRSRIDELGPEGFVRSLSAGARASWFEAILLAEDAGDCVAQNPGQVKDAIALAGYLEGRRPIPVAAGVRMNDPSVNFASVTVSEGDVEEVWCPHTDLGTWTAVDEDQIFLTGNTGDANHGRGNHLHLSWKRGTSGLPKSIGNAAGGLDEVPKIEVKGPKGARTRELAQSSLNKARDAANKKIEDAAASTIGGIGGMDASRVRGALSPGQARRIFAQALKMVGVRRNTGQWISMLLRQAMRESGLNPNAVNNWDSNAARGDPSKGMLQTIGATFKRFAMRGHNNILNPLDNALAAIRYMIATYGGGNQTRALRTMIARGGGAYARGGELGGPEGHPVDITAHSGEWILNRGQQGKVAGWLGTNVNSLRDRLGFGGERRRFQEGGEVGLPSNVMLIPMDKFRRMQGRSEAGATGLDEPSTELQEARRERRENTRAVKDNTKEQKKGNDKKDKDEKDPAKYEAPDIPPYELPEFYREFSKARSFLDRLKVGAEGFADRFSEALEVFTGEDGLLTQAQAAIERVTARAELATKRFPYRVERFRRVRMDPSGQNVVEDMGTTARIRKVRTDEEIIKHDLESMADLYEELARFNQEVRSLFSLAKRRAQQVMARMKRLRRGGLDGKEQKEHDSLMETYEALIQDQRTLEDKVLESDQALADQAIARHEKQVELEQKIIENVNRRATRGIAAIEIRRRIANAMGNLSVLPELAAQQIGVLEKQIVELEERLKVLKDQGMTTEAEDLEDAIADLRAQVIEGSAQMLQDAAEEVNRVFSQQMGMADLADRMFSATGSVGNRGKVFSLRERALREQRSALEDLLERAKDSGNDRQVDELKMALKENEVAVRENSRARFLADVESKASRFQFRTSMNDVRARIVTIKGELGGEVDQQRLVELAQDQEKELKNYRSQLQRFLRKAEKMDDTEQERALRLQLKENELALLENTKNIKELNGTLNPAQTFTSRGWEQFRNAIFNGMGGVLADYRIDESMIAPNRVLAPSRVVDSMGFPVSRKPTLVERHNTNDITINEVKERVDTTELSQRIAFAETRE